jgi:hypothetical protein
LQFRLPMFEPAYRQHSSLPGQLPGRVLVGGDVQDGRQLEKLKDLVKHRGHRMDNQPAAALLEFAMMLDEPTYSRAIQVIGVFQVEEHFVGVTSRTEQLLQWIDGALKIVHGQVTAAIDTAKIDFGGAKSKLHDSTQMICVKIAGQHVCSGLSQASCRNPPPAATLPRQTWTRAAFKAFLAPQTLLASVSRHSKHQPLREPFVRPLPYRDTEERFRTATEREPHAGCDPESCYYRTSASTTTKKR